MSNHSISEKSEFDAYQAADLVRHLNKKGITSLTAIRVLKIAALIIEVNVCDVERQARLESEISK